MAILYIVSCLPLFVLNCFCDKYTSSLNDHSLNKKYNVIKFIMASILVIPFFFTDKLPLFGIGALSCGIGCGICYAVNKTAMLMGYEKGSVAFMTLFHTSGMIIPCIIGAIFWNEPVSLLAWIGVVIVIGSIMLLKESADSKEKKAVVSSALICGLLVFLASGGTMVCQKLMGRAFIGESVSAYNMYSFISAAVILAILPGKGTKEKVKPPKKVMWAATGSAISQFTISMVMTNLASSVPSVILFPLFNGVGIILVTLMSAVFFKEKITVRKTVGVILGLIGLMLITIG